MEVKIKLLKNTNDEAKFPTANKKKNNRRWFLKEILLLNHRAFRLQVTKFLSEIPLYGVRLINRFGNAMGRSKNLL